MGGGSDREELLSSEQGARAAAAIATAVPLLVVVGSLGAATLWGARHAVGGGRNGRGAVAAGAGCRVGGGGAELSVVLVTLVLPTLAAILSLSPRRDHGVIRVWKQFSPSVGGSLFLASMAGLCAGVAAFCATVRGGGWWWLGASLVTFLLGGQLLAIALIRLYNRPLLLGLGLQRARRSWSWRTSRGSGGWRCWRRRCDWSRPWRAVRDMAAVDGAGDGRAAAHVVWPLAWPLLAAAAVLVMVLVADRGPRDRPDLAPAPAGRSSPC